MPAQRLLRLKSDTPKPKKDWNRVHACMIRSVRFSCLVSSPLLSRAFRYSRWCLVERVPERSSLPSVSQLLKAETLRQAVLAALQVCPNGIPVKDVAKTIDDDVMEYLCEAYPGGLATYLKQNAGNLVAHHHVGVAMVNGLQTVKLQRLSCMAASTQVEPEAVLHRAYNMYRLAPHLKTCEFTPLADLKHLEDTVLDESIIDVIRANPQRFLVDDRETPTAVKYVLPSHIQEEIIPVEDESAVRKEEALLSEQIKESKHAFRRLTLKRKLRSLQRRILFPAGTPFYDPLVAAYFVYDLLQPGRFVSRSAILSSLEECGVLIKCRIRFEERFFSQFAYLFRVEHVDGEGDGNFLVQRIEADEAPVSAQTPLTELEALMLLSQALPKNFDASRSICASTLQNKVPLKSRKAFLKMLRTPGSLISAVATADTNGTSATGRYYVDQVQLHSILAANHSGVTTADL